MLEAKVVRVSRSTIGFSVAPTRTGVEITFDFLERKDGACIEVLHTAPTPLFTFVTGTIKGAGRPLKLELPPQANLGPPVARYIATLSIAFSYFGLLLSQGPEFLTPLQLWLTGLAAVPSFGFQIYREFRGAKIFIPRKLRKGLMIPTTYWFRYGLPIDGSVGNQEDLS